MDLSVLDLSPVPDGGTAADAYATTVDVAQQAERLGYSRVWVAEHHGMGGAIAGTTPEVLLGHLAAETDAIRIGSGAVLLNHYSPFKVAEAFAVLDGLAPGRIDAGLGRANGSPASDRALGTDRHVADPDKDHEEKIEAVVSHLYDDYPPGHPYGDLELPRSGAAEPVPWVLGSSPSSAAIAGDLGLRFCFAAFIRPTFAEAAFETYREHFQSTGLADGIEAPEGMIAVNAVCAESDEAAAKQRAVAEAVYRRMERGIVGSRPGVDEAIDELGGVPEPTPAKLDTDEWPRALSGSPATLDELLGQLADRVGVDEVMIHQSTASDEAVRRSHRLLAEECGLEPR